MKKIIFIILIVWVSQNIFAEEVKEKSSYWERMKEKISLEKVKKRVDDKLYEISQKDGVKDSGSKLFKAMFISNKSIKIMSDKVIKELDSEHNLSVKGNKYFIRIKKIEKDLKLPKNIKLDLQVYMDSQVNAFALANGSVRMYSGLMDVMTDDELIFVLGHELGHVKLHHGKKQYQLAYGLAGLEDETTEKIGVIGDFIGKLSSALINAKFSRHEEKDSDEYGVDFLRLNGLSKASAISSLEKLNANSASMLSSHPSSADRVRELKEL